jgi:hypothetical protein
MKGILDWSMTTCAVAMAVLNIASSGSLVNQADAAIQKSRVCSGGTSMACPIHTGSCFLTPFPVPNHRAGGSCVYLCFSKCDTAPCHGIDTSNNVCVTSVGCK